MVSRGIGSFLRHDQCLSATSSLQPPNPAAIGGIDPKLGEKRKRTLCDKRPGFQGESHYHRKRDNPRSGGVL